MNIVLFIGFFMSLFLIVLLAGKRNKIHADRILLSILVVYGLTIGGPYIELYNRANNYPYPHLMNIAWLFLLLHGPLLWLYIKSLIDKTFRIEVIHLLHLLPFTVFLFIHFFQFLTLSGDEKVFLLQNEAFTSTVFFRIRGIAIGISSIGYNIWALILLKRHRKNIENHFSNTENKDLSWLRTLVIASLIIFSVNVLLFNVNNFLHFTGFYEIMRLAYSFSALYVLYIGYFGIKQPDIFVHFQISEAGKNHSSLKDSVLSSALTEGYAEIRSNLTKLIEKERPFLDPELSLAKLSNLMKIKPEVLSSVLNSLLGQSFFDFINKLRVEEFKIQCLNKENKHLSIMGIAYECGFNSKAAFYRAFKKYEGISPTEYISGVSQ